MKKEHKKLLSKQERFARFYRGDAAEAAIKAGYSRNGAKDAGNRLLRDARIVALIQRRQDEEARLDQVSEGEIMRALTAIIRSDDTKPADRLKALELAGRRMAMWTDRHLVGGIEGELRSIPDEDLDRRIAAVLGDLQAAGELPGEGVQVASDVSGSSSPEIQDVVAGTAQERQEASPDPIGPGSPAPAGGPRGPWYQ